MGGGGQWLLRGVPHVLRVRVIAPSSIASSTFVKRAAAMGETATRERDGRVRRDDPEKAGRMRYLYEVDLRSRSDDLVINAEKLTYQRRSR